MREIIIIGKGESRVECPKDTTIEKWGVNDLFKEVDYKVDKTFFFDDEAIPECFTKEELKNQKIVTKNEINGLDVTVFPLKEICERFKTKYFSNTICYMIAYALYLGYERIYFYGVDMKWDIIGDWEKEHGTVDGIFIYKDVLNEWRKEEKSGVSFWFGIATGMGVEIINTEYSTIAKEFLYAYKP